MTATQSLGPRLRELREARGLSQDQLVDISRHALNQGRIGQFERGEKRPSPRVASQLAEALGLSVFELVENPSDLAWPADTIALAECGGGYEAISAEHTGKLADIGWLPAKLSKARLSDLITLAGQKGRSIAFWPKQS